jgi:hypothetical protein
MMLLLRSSGYYSDEVAALFVGIAERESHWHPGSINTNRNTGDFSFGFLQMNLLPNGHGSKTFSLSYPTKASVLGYKLAYSTTADTDPEVLKNKVKTIATLETTDERIFIPYNQVAMLLTVALSAEEANRIIKTLKPVDKFIFHAWGDYNVYPENDSRYNPDYTVGTLGSVKYSTVRNAYTINTGKSEEVLKAWIRKAFTTVKSPGLAYLDRWFAGSVFALKYGTETKDPKF